jgi:hypothetical protein
VTDSASARPLPRLATVVFAAVGVAWAAAVIWLLTYFVPAIVELVGAAISELPGRLAAAPLWVLVLGLLASLAVIAWSAHA